jgi:hypothetical protein
MLLAGGWQGLYRYNGSGWSQVTTIDAPNPTAASAENTTTHLHRHLWYGVHDIYMDSNGLWYVACYAPSTADGSFTGSKGIYRSTTSAGTTFEQIRDGHMYQAVAVDSCGARLYFTSGRGFSSPVNGSDQFQGHGLEIGRWDGSNLRVEDAFAPGDGIWGFPQAHAIRAPDDFGVYVIAPGYGIHKVTGGGACSGGGGGCEGGCETERPGGAASASSAPAGGESVAKLPQTVFTVAVVRNEIAEGRLVLYDLTGRKTKSPRPGVYFVLVRNPAGIVTSRRMVIVTP